MTIERAIAHSDTADDYRSRSEYGKAGEYYTAAAYEYFGHDTFEPPGQRVSHGEYMFLRAGICYLLHGKPDRCENRCRQGILVAEDMVDRALAKPTPDNFYDQARRGAWYEYVGDFRVLAHIEGADEAYDLALEIYNDAGDPETGFSEQEHMWLMAFFQSVAEAVGYDREEWNTVRTDYKLSEWLEYKRTRLPNLIDKLAKSGEWKNQHND